MVDLVIKRAGYDHAVETEEQSQGAIPMSVMIIFVAGYIVGGLSALLVIGLARAGRSDRSEHSPIEMVNRDVEHYSL
jgi:hypothetical protein